jgi:ankyrin repeat protein
MYNLSLLEMFVCNSKVQKLFFIPCGSGNPTNSKEISKLDLFQYLLKENSNLSIKEIFVEKLLQNLTEIDAESKIVQLETHRQNCAHINAIDPIKPFQIFVVFKTESKKDGKFYWSLEETAKDAVVLQRSRHKDEVKNKFKGETREGTQIIAEELEGKGCMRELLTLLWIHMILDAKYQRDLSRCESLIPLIMKKITKIRYEYEKEFTYSALSAEERNPDLSDIINFFLNVSNWHPLVVATYLGDVEFLDRVQQDGKYNINDIYNNFTLLNLAILFSKTEMFQHLLEKWKADPTKCDEKGRNALHMAAKFNKEKEIVNSLLKNKKILIDQCDATRTTALHHAIMASNTEIVEYLLDNGADPKKMDRIGRSPLCVAASYATDKKIIDILLQKKETVNIDDCDKFGVTALHHAAMASNNKMARHLLAKGADINCRDKNGLTPLHVAAFLAKDMDLIDLFLNNEKVNLHCCDELGQNVIAYAEKNTYGLRQEIIHRVNKIDYEIIEDYNLLKLTKSEMDIPSWKSFVLDLHDHLGYANILLLPISALITHSLVMKNKKMKLFYVPYADLKPGKGIEISESLLTRYIVNKKSIKQLNISKSEMSITTKLLGDLDRCSQIAQVQIYRRSNNSPANFMRTQLFVVFKTTSDKDGERWWSVDENADYIVLQRSRDKDAVTNKFGGKERKDPTPVTGKLVGKGSIKNLFTILWIHQVMEEKDRIKSSNRQSFVPILSKQITVRNNNKDNSPHQSDGTLDLISDLSSGISKLHPLFLPISLGNAKLFEKISEIRKCDPAKRDASGRNALEMAAMLADNTEILDLLLKYESVEINDCDESGRTALHFAAASSNVVAARHLIKMGANPNRKDKLGRTPLHYAAFIAKDINIVDVLLNDKQVRVNSLDNGGQTALSYAECNQHGLTREIVSRLKDKCIMHRRFGNHTFVLDTVIPNANQELDPSLLPVKREGGDSDERKTQLDDPHRTAPQPEGSRLKSGLKNASAKILIIFIHYTVIVLLYISKLKRNEGEESAKGFTTFFTIIGKIAKKSEINKFAMQAKRRARAWTH